MRARIVRIGNSQGIRIPKILLEQTRLEDEVELKVQDNEIVISASQKARAGWEDSFREMAQRGDDGLLDGPLPSLSRWDAEDWEW
jgi:antitoxin MazE